MRRELFSYIIMLLISALFVGGIYLAISQVDIPNGNSEMRIPVELIMNVKIRKPIEVWTTAYAWTGYRMYNNEYPFKGAIAIKLPNKYGWEIGDKFLINGKKYQALDRLPSYNLADIDIYMDNKSDCIKWGFKKINIIK